MKVKNVLGKVGLVAAGTALLLGLGACGSSKKDSASGDAKLSDKTITKKTTLEVYASAGKNQNYLKSVAKMYNKEKGANIKLKFVTVASGTATVQMITPKLVSHEDMPDIVSISDSSSAGILSKFEDSFYSATDYGFYKKYGNEFYTSKLNMLKAQSSSKEVIPWANDITPAVSYYQPALFEKVGVNFEDIKSWDQFIEVGKKIKAETGTGMIALPEAGDQELFIDIMNQQNTQLLDAKGNIQLKSDAAKNAAEIIKKMVDAGIVNFFGSNDGEKTFQESATFVAGGWYSQNMSLNFPEASGKWKVSPIVPFSEDNAGKTPPSGGSSWYVPKKASNPAVAQQFLSYILSNKACLEEGLNLGLPLSNKEAYNTDAASKEFDYFGGQKVYEILNKANKNSSKAIYPASYSDATAYLATATYAYWKSGDYSSTYIKQAQNFADKYSAEVTK